MAQADDKVFWVEEIRPVTGVSGREAIRNRKLEFVVASSAVLASISASAREILNTPNPERNPPSKMEKLLKEDLSVALSEWDEVCRSSEGDKPERFTLGQLRVVQGIVALVLSCKMFIHNGIVTPSGIKRRTEFLPFCLDEQRNLVIAYDREIPFSYLVDKVKEAIRIINSVASKVAAQEVLRVFISLLREDRVRVPDLRRVK